MMDPDSSHPVGVAPLRGSASPSDDSEHIAEVFGEAFARSPSDPEL